MYKWLYWLDRDVSDYTDCLVVMDKLCFSELSAVITMPTATVWSALYTDRIYFSECPIIVVPLSTVITTPTTTVWTTPESGCFDTISYCSTYGPGVCSDPMYKAWVLDNCQKYCGICGQCILLLLFCGLVYMFCIASVAFQLQIVLSGMMWINDYRLLAF